MRVIISAGHGLKIRGAAGPEPWGLDEVDEARRVTTAVAEALRELGIEVTTYWDNVSTTQDENLRRIVDFHNSKSRDLDVSIHFNAYEVTTTKKMGTECLFVSQQELAADIAAAVAAASSLPDRGAKYRDDLYFLNNTEAKSVLVEVVFCDAKPDADSYRQNFDLICDAIADAIAGEEIEAPPEQPEPGTDEHPTIQKGDQGEAVAELQKVLGLIADGDFGSITDMQVEGFQAACGLSADGIVGPNTWDEVDDLEARLAAGGERLSARLINEIGDLARASPLDGYEWPDRGMSPPGYITGMGCCYAVAVQDLDDGVDYATAMAKALGNSDVDALKLYESEFKQLGIALGTVRERLLALFVLMIGLGMRESSGRYCEGRDLSASNVEADTCEAGLFQTSWNIRSADSSLPGLLTDYWRNPNGFLPEFRENVEPTADNLDCYGTGEGAKYQWLAKYCPAFAVMTAGVGLRNRKDHWGPVKRKEVTLRKEAATLLKQIDDLLDDEDAMT
jgi:N-acetylmuramoyl-L-alanine amidase/Putative peptidoglycan binding domain